MGEKQIEDQLKTIDDEAASSSRGRICHFMAWLKESARSGKWMTPPSVPSSVEVDKNVASSPKSGQSLRIDVMCPARKMSICLLVLVLLNRQ